MVSRVTAAFVALLVAAPAGFGAAFAEPPADDMMGCCPTADDGDEHDEPTIARRCCCDVERPAPVEPSQRAPAISSIDHQVVAAVVEVPVVLQAPGAPAIARLPAPRGPPPRTTLLSKKTSLLL